ncbi:ABC transporter substrate-binding protein [Fredinandcohnia onubensis]|uniref:ABC transporter substrate-binding protein n=1 Tax=Fredinandcohnia onubensis TaxID=1571209 RepID=UPI000C0BE522|nr:sugar ABC transporter substrate-binding protein [Fredinandcohnia onubensis]
MKEVFGKFSTLFLLLLLVFLVACSSTDSNSTESGSKDLSGSTVNILLSKSDSTEDLQQRFIPEFEEKTGIKVNVDILPESGMEQKTILTLSSGTADYDVFMVSSRNWSQITSAGWLNPLDDLMNNPETTSEEYKSGFSDKTLNALRFDDKLYGVPYQIGTNMLFYNKKMFEEAGLDPNKGPENMDELLEYAKKLHKPEKDQAGFVIRGTREGGDNGFPWLMLWFLSGGKWTDVEGKDDYAVLDAEPAIKTAKYYDELMKYTPSGISNYSFAEAQQAMQQGKAAMWMDGAVLGPPLEDPEKSKIAGNVGYHVMEGTSDEYTVGSIWSFVMAKNAQNKEAAWELMKYITSKEVVLEQALSGTNGSPTRSDVLLDEKIAEAFNPNFTKALLKASEHAITEYTPLIPEGPEIRNALSIALSKIIADEAEPEKAMIEANEEVKKIIKD